MSRPTTGRGPTVSRAPSSGRGLAGFARPAVSAGVSVAARVGRAWPALAAGGVGLASGLVAATGGLGWYFSGMVLAVDTAAEYPLRIRDLDGDRVVLGRDVDTVRPARLGLSWAGGHALLGPEVTHGRGVVIRRVERVVAGTLRPGLRTYVTGFYYDGDPTSVHGLPYRTVNVEGELGAMPAWYLPPAGVAGSPPTPSDSPAPPSGDPAEAPGGAGRTWVIAVHGRGARPAEALRVLPALHAAGLPTLVITYRNDEGAPASPDGLYHLGDSEWRDLAAAVRYAQDHGATGVVLLGWSMGGAISLTALHRMAPEQATLVRAVVLDCPVIDWHETLATQAQQRRLPWPLYWTAARLTERRSGLRLADLDHRRQAWTLGVPVLLFVDLDDVIVHPGPALDYARMRPDLVTLVQTRDGGHTRSWNVDPDGYAVHLTAFLDRCGVLPRHHAR